MTRFVRSSRKLEDRVEEVWIVADEEDDLETWREDSPLAIVGRPTTRLDSGKRVAGAARYTVDLAMPAMLHASVLRSPIAHGRVQRLDAEAARSMPGVRAVITPDSAVGFVSKRPLLTLEPEYVGHPIAALATETLEQADAALAAFALELETLPFVVDCDEALRDLRFTHEPVETRRGDPDAAFAEADVKVELHLTTPSHLHTPLEPHAAVAAWEDGQLVAWISTQGVFEARSELADAFEIPRSRIRVMAKFVGGAFGAKLAAGFEGILAAELARQTGRPVRLANDRHAEQLDGGQRALTRQSIRLAARRDGTLLGISADAVVGMGAGGVLTPVLLPASSLYACENVETMLFPVKLNLQPHRTFRAPGLLEGTAILEQAIDDLAHACGIDPLELRRRIHADTDAETGLAYSNKRLLACYDRAAELAGWVDREQLREPQADGRLRGMGCSSQICWGEGGPPAHATVRVDAAGHALVVTGINDLGTGAFTCAQMIAAEELGFPIERVQVTGGDTEPNVFAPFAAGSMTTPSVMPAVRSAAGKVRKKLLDLAGGLFEVSPHDLYIEAGRIRLRGGGLDRAVTEVTELLGDDVVDGSGVRGPNPEGIVVDSFGCQIAQISVEPVLGDIRVEHVFAVHDSGLIVNPLTATSQVEGGILQGMAFALTEERVVDPTTGAPTNANLDDYVLPTIADTPEITVDFISIPDEHMPNVGARGLGEPPIVPTPAAIANAFRHATGRRCTAMPMTRARVLEALR